MVWSDSQGAEKYLGRDRSPQRGACEGKVEDVGVHEAPQSEEAGSGEMGTKISQTFEHSAIFNLRSLKSCAKIQYWATY